MSGWRAARTILFKELVETLRDRKTLIIMVVLPLVLYPLIFLALGQATMMQQEKLAATALELGLQGRAPAALDARLRGLEATTIVPVDDAAAAVGAGEVVAALVIPEAAHEALAAGGRATLEVVFDGGSDASREAEQRLRKALEGFAEEVIDARLEARRLERAYVEPLKVEASNVAPPERQGGWILGQILPLLVSMLMIGATFYPAIDLTAGEKERGTLQTLLTAPISPFAIVGGKYLAVVVLALLTGLMNLASMTLVALSIPLPDELAGEMSFAFGADVFLLVLLCLLLLGMMFGALMMAIAVTAKSFKEAQNYLTPVYLVCIFPLLIAGLPGVQLTSTTAVLPLLNLALAMKQLLVGPVPAGLLLTVFLSTAAFIALFLALAARVFRLESVLLGDEGLRAVFKRRTGDAHRPPVPTLGEVVTLLGLVLLLLFYGSLALSGASVLAIVHVTQWGFLLTPALILVFALRLDVRATLWLRRPPAWALAAAIGFGTSLWLAAALATEALAKDWLPVPSPALEELTEQLVALGAEPGSAALLFLGVAVAPALCEEVLFRGVVLSALARRVSPVAAVVTQAVLFSIYHLNVYQAPTTLIIGLVLGALVLRSGSLWPAVVIHALHNGITLAVQLYAGEAALSTPWLHAVWLGLAVAIALLVTRPGRGPRIVPLPEPDPE